MASNGEIETEDTEISENNGEKVVTMMDVLQEQEDFEEDANAVLGASDDKNCTYALGYINRQAIYACMTCCTEAKDDPTKRAGVCLACSLTCHENHDLIELYTKRNFRCDCGNPKFNSHPCQFTPNKIDLNEENSYNQNFSGVYCICHRPYPDPEATDEDEMIQCILCEDWLHASHLEATVPSAQYSEMICKGCMQKNEFLHGYCDLALNTENDYVEVVSLNSSTEVNGMNEDMKNESQDNTKKTGPSAGDLEIPQENCNEMKNDPEMTDSKTLDDKTEEDSKFTIKENITTPSDINQTESNTTMHTDNAEHSTTTAQDETKCDDNRNTISEIKATTFESVILESIGLVGEKIESHINALNDVVEPTEKPTKVVDIEKPIEEENKDSIVGPSNPVTTEPKVQDLNVGESIEMEISNNEKEIDENTSSAVSDTSSSEKCKASQDENVNATDNSSNTVAEINTSTNQSNESTNDNTTIDKPEEVIQTIEATNLENSLESSNKKSEEELEKIEEDKLLEDPDESMQKEISESNNESHVNKSTKEVSDLNSQDKSNYGLNNAGSNIQNTDGVAPNFRRVEQEMSTLEQREETTANNNSSDDPISDKTAHNISANKNNISGSEMENNGTTNSIDEETSDESNIKPEIKRKLSCESSDSDAKKRKVDPIECKRPQCNKKQCKGATFWPSHFRQKLCTCTQCLSMYKDLSVLFILDPEDTVTAYENLGKEKTNGKPQSQYEKGLQALSSLDRIQQINVLTEYNKMRDKFLDFLKSFKDRRKIVTEDDVKAFFAGMKPTKRADGVYFCR